MKIIIILEKTKTGYSAYAEKYAITQLEAY